MKGKMLYKDGVHSFNHNGLGVFTSNTMPNIKIDSGVARRICALEHKSKFVEDKKQVNEANHIYLKNQDFQEDVKHLLNAWIDILVVYAHKWLEGLQPELPQSFSKCKEEIIDVNDIYQDMIDAKLIVTGLSKDRIGKYRMEEIFKEMFPNRGTTQQILRDKLREKKIEYNKDLSPGNGDPRGVYIGIRERDILDSFIEKDDDLVPDSVLDKEQEKVQSKKKVKVDNYESDCDDKKVKKAALAGKKTVIKAAKTTSKKPVQDYDFVEENDELVPDSVLDKEQEKLQSKKKTKVADNCESDCDDETIQETVKELSCLLEF
jgi:hypothetical protein